MIAIDKSTEANLQSQLERMNPSPSRPLPKLPVENVRIRAEIYHGDDGNINGFSVEERGGKSVNELQIYCASIWILVRAAFSCVKDHLKRDVTFERDANRLTMRLTTAPDAVTEAVFQTMLIGLRQVEKLAPKIINVKENFPGGENK